MIFIAVTEFYSCYLSKSYLVNKDYFFFCEFFLLWVLFWRGRVGCF